ncbi:TVP38/TMEM64 family protein [Staphylococcus massiliensis]|uniref:TVP38/TMEM64 family protein n=1 Tax=Staphylococcus massiliensis TaxID=555791 RepID=UPI001EE0FF83|nr:VTT domain-containing protein [Staphylococcus massiliensis]MCG3401628.1 VTT domain-containing protein [Staphylococcus massiliensis]
MTQHELSEIYTMFKGTGFDLLFGFLLTFIEAFLPILPIIVFVVFNVNAFGLGFGILVSWLGTVIGSFLVFLCFKRLNHISYIKRLKTKKHVKRLIYFIDRRGVTPIFILLCFPFTPSALVNIVVSMTHIRKGTYFVALCLSKAIMIGSIGILGHDITTLLHNPLKLIAIIIGVVVLYMISKRVERNYMNTVEEDEVESHH